MGTPHVVLYSRPGCHLCDDARGVLLEVMTRIPFDLQEIDIDGNDALTREYGIRIPVVSVNGVDMWEYRVEAGEFESALRGI